MIIHRHPLASELLRLGVLLTLAAMSITIGLPFLLALAATAGR